MNTKHFVALTSIVLATGLSQSVTYAQAPQLAMTSTFNDVLAPRSEKNPSLQTDLVPTLLPEQGASLNAHTLQLSKGRKVLVCQKEDRVPPRTSPPGGSR